MSELISDKKPLSKGNSVVVDSVSVNKGVATGRKLRRVKAIITTPPVDMATIKDAIEIVVGLATISDIVEKIGKKIKRKKNDHDKVDIVTERIETENIKVKRKSESKHSANKPKTKS